MRLLVNYNKQPGISPASPRKQRYAMYRLAIGPERQTLSLNLPALVLVDLFSSDFDTEEDAQDALDTLAETIEEHNP